jgi:hypothetical protein
MTYSALARALYDYSPSHDEEAALREGQIVYVSTNGDPAWKRIKNKNTGEQGLVPASYIEEVRFTRGETDKHRLYTAIRVKCSIHTFHK